MGVKRWNGSAYEDIDPAKFSNSPPVKIQAWVGGAYVTIWEPPVINSAAAGGYADDSAGGANTTFTVAAGIVGAIRIVTYRRSTTGRDITALSGGGVTTWNKVNSQTAQGGVFGLWWGVVTSTSGTVVTATWDGSLGFTTTIGYATHMFTSSKGAATTWTFDNGNMSNGGAATSHTSPTLTPTLGGDELFCGNNFASQVASAGSTPGAVYIITVNSDCFFYCLDVDSAYSVTNPQTSGTRVSHVGLWKAS
jgi:hypothetical protein